MIRLINERLSKKFEKHTSLYLKKVHAPPLHPLDKDATKGKLIKSYQQTLTRLEEQKGKNEKRIQTMTQNSSAIALQSQLEEVNLSIKELLKKRDELKIQLLKDNAS